MAEVGIELFILTDFDFSSNTGAAFSRMQNYAKAFTLHNRNKCYISNIGTNWLEIIEIDTNIYISCPRFKSSKKLFFRVYKSHISFYRTLRYLKKSLKYSKTKNCKTIFLIHAGGFSLTFLALIYLQLIKRQQVFYEKNELAIGIALNIRLKGFVNYFLIRNILLLPSLIFSFLVDFFAVFFSGIIVISTRLERLYSNLNKNVMLIPILVSEFYFQNPKKNHNETENEVFVISSTGGILPEKEGIEFMLIAISFLIKKGISKRIIYNIYGNNTQKYNNLFHDIINRLSLNSFVNIYDNKSRDEIKEILYASDLLVLTREKNLQTNFGFSTKLGEYLASGTPVLLSDVSDNGIYLTHDENAFFCDLNSIDNTVNVLNSIISNREKAHHIGLNGKNIAFNKFFLEKYSSIFISFLSNRDELC